jgi:hypothetical protein
MIGSLSKMPGRNAAGTRSSVHSEMASTYDMSADGSRDEGGRAKGLR